jgi:hypothetical protein
MAINKIGPETFAGAWRLLDAYSEAESGRYPFPLGDAALGFIMYDAFGHMSAQLMSANRLDFSSRHPEEVQLEEFKVAYQGYTSYYGTYTIDAEKSTITHHVEGSLAPSWVGRDQVRFFELVDGELYLKTPPIRVADGTKVVNTLRWCRV